MTTIFEETGIKGLKIKNRLVRSATWEGMCDPDGRPTEKLISLYRGLTDGGIGLLISGYTFVRPEGKQLAGALGINSDAFKEEYKRVVKTVHDAGGTIAIQLVHAGGQAIPDNAGGELVAPSAVMVAHYQAKPRALSFTEIKELINAFGEGAYRAREYGFDAVQLHAAHGYLLNQFMSPHANLRKDEYGGEIENRSRFVIEVYQKVRANVGDDFPVMIKMNCADNMDGGLQIDDGLYVAKRLSDAGIDAIEVSSGNSASGIKYGPLRMRVNRPEKEAWNMPYAREVKKIVNCPVMVVGGFRSYEICEKAVKEDAIDYVTMSRPLIREPDLAARWKSGDTTKARCISCNRCFKPGAEEGGIYCVAEKNEREKEI
ncbi:MAG: NADH:flavin oxidoreductase [Desulfatiglans sp.]|nr:NADH:flavin oxidoreductase [Desulfatiglans sp.]